MLNSIETYFEAGQMTARARNERDEGRVSFHKSWFSRAKSLENEADKAAATAAFDKGYQSVRNTPKPSPFA